MKARKLLVLAVMLTMPSLQGCKGDWMGFMQKLHPLVGKVLDGYAKKDKPKDDAKKDDAKKADKPDKPGAPVDDGAAAKKSDDAKKTETGNLDRPKA